MIFHFMKDYEISSKLLNFILKLNGTFRIISNDHIKIQIKKHFLKVKKDANEQTPFANRYF